MPYQKKYYFSFKDIRLVERLHLVELWQNTETVLVAEEIKGHMNPFAVEMPEIDHKFQVVRGCGCQINLLSETDMKFFTGLYHVNPTDFMVKHYIDGVINFLGYLNAEMMTEPYDIDFNYQVSTTGNDGFSLMDRFSFISADDGTNYQGIASKIGLLQIVFAKIGLPFTEYRIALSTTFTGYSGAANSTILHESFIDCANFYDEDEKPMSLREMVESILAPYGAYIRAEGGIIYITDIHSLASLESVTYKRFDYATDVYISDITISNVKAIADIGYFGTGHSIERSGGVNRQVVAYSPYPIKTILEESIVGIDEFVTVPATFTLKDGYYYRTLEINKFWGINQAIVVNPPTFEESYYEDKDNSQLYLRYPGYGGVNTKIASLTENTYLSISKTTIVNGAHVEGLKLVISGQILIKTKNNPYNDTQTSKEITDIAIKILIKIGQKYLSKTGSDIFSGYEWTDTPSFIYLYSNNDTKVAKWVSTPNVITDRFINIGYWGEGFQIPLGNISTNVNFNGTIEVEIYSDYAHQNLGYISYIHNSTDIKEIWLKDISINVKNINDNEIPDNDIEYIGLLDRTYQNEGDKITLTCGTDSVFSDRGKILKFDDPDYSDITQWTRNAQTFKIEELLLGSVSSNYQDGFITLSNMKLKNSFTLQNILTDTFIGAAKMMVKSANINYQDNVFECSLIEILPDELIIVKDATVK